VDVGGVRVGGSADRQISRRLRHHPFQQLRCVAAQQQPASRQRVWSPAYRIPPAPCRSSDSCCWVPPLSLPTAAAAAAAADELTGFAHNGVSPIAIKTRMPIILSHRQATPASNPGSLLCRELDMALLPCCRCQPASQSASELPAAVNVRRCLRADPHTSCCCCCRIAELQPDTFFLGAGEVDLKVGFSAADFIAAYQVRGKLGWLGARAGDPPYCWRPPGAAAGASACTADWLAGMMCKLAAPAAACHPWLPRAAPGAGLHLQRGR
jgi:hypothetical protein